MSVPAPDSVIPLPSNKVQTVFYSTQLPNSRRLLGVNQSTDIAERIPVVMSSQNSRVSLLTEWPREYENKTVL